MTYIKRLLGLYDKKQEQRSEEVSAYIHDKKNAFTTEMIKIQTQAHVVHEKTKQAHEESVKLKEIVDDVTRNIALATGTLKYKSK